MEPEIWKDIPGFEGRYQVSNLGQVRSLPGGCRKDKILSPGRASTGYLTVVLWRDGRGKTFQVQSLVMSAFVGAQPKGSNIRHLDGNRSNNVLSNLCYGTPTQNYRDVYDIGRTHRKLTREDVAAIRDGLRNNVGKMELAERYGVCERVIRNIRAGRSFAWLE